MCGTSAAPAFRSNRDSPHDVTVTEGSDHTFNCDTYAKPEATVEWYMNGVRINGGPMKNQIHNLSIYWLINL